MRGKSLASMMNEMEEAEIVAVSDVYEDRMGDIAALVEQACGRAPKQYADYRKALEEKEVDAVVIATSWESHVTIAADSMRAGKVTALEVGGAYTVEDCESLVRVYEETKTPFMFLENCCYGKFELLSTALVRRGMMGRSCTATERMPTISARKCWGKGQPPLPPQQLPHAQLRKLPHARTRAHRPPSQHQPRQPHGEPCFRRLQSGRASNVRRRSPQPRSHAYGQAVCAGDIVNTLITCEDGTTISLKLDTTLPRFYSREFTVRGTKGCCLQELNAVLLDDDGLEEFFDPNKSVRKYLDSAKKFSEYLPDIWKEAEKGRLTGGHGGMDMLMLREFFRAVLEGSPCPSTSTTPPHGW